MHPLFVLFLLTQISASFACLAQINFAACLNRGEEMFNLCAYSDMACKCQRQKDLLQCYALCGDDYQIKEQSKIQQGQIQVYCGAVPTSLPATPSATPSATSSAAALASLVATSVSSASGKLLSITPTASTQPQTAATSTGGAVANRISGAELSKILTGIMMGAGLLVVMGLIL
ncbi:uncharacterized protein VTP21DRAFT_8079 [Calcarisporiella thermophila]|uniref:uncharacterized protein n=1 Tax=Calcarisporiella thermophila TaxID=911321 RepID=UPI00374406FB